MPEVKPVIPPTIGRRVLLFVGTIVANNPGETAVNDLGVPFDAGIAYVWDDKGQEKNAINCGYCDHAGVAGAATSVILYDRPLNETDAHGKGETYAVWMPHQFEQAQRAAQPKAPAPIAVASLGERADFVDMDRLKTHDNGVPVRGHQLSADPGVPDPAAEGVFADGGVLEGTNRTTSGAIGQP
jgi:hypothetical protein